MLAVTVVQVGLSLTAGGERAAVDRVLELLGDLLVAGPAGRCHVQMADLRLGIHRTAELMHPVAVRAAGAALGAGPAVNRLGVRRERLGEPDEPVGDQPRLPVTRGAQIRHLRVEGRRPRVQALEDLVGVSVAVLAGRSLLVSPRQCVPVQALRVLILHVVVALATVGGLQPLGMRIALVVRVTLDAVDRLPVDGLLEHLVGDEERRVRGRRLRLPGEEGEVVVTLLAGNGTLGSARILLGLNPGGLLLAEKGGWGN